MKTWWGCIYDQCSDLVSLRLRLDIASPKVQSPHLLSPTKVRSIPHAACWRRICRCFRAASNFRSRPVSMSCCRPASMSFGVM